MRIRIRNNKDINWWRNVRMCYNLIYSGKRRHLYRDKMLPHIIHRKVVFFYHIAYKAEMFREKKHVTSFMEVSIKNEKRLKHVWPQRRKNPMR